MNGILSSVSKIVIETNKKDPEIIAEITEAEIIPAENYRVRLMPKVFVEGSAISQDCCRDTWISEYGKGIVSGLGIGAILLIILALIF